MEVLELSMTGNQEARLKLTEGTLKVGWPLKVASGNNQKATRKTGYDLKWTQLHINFIPPPKKNKPNQPANQTKTHNSIIPNRQYQVYLYKENYGACFSPENPS